MGYKSTVEIQRSEAIEKILGGLLRCSNATLGNVLEEINDELRVVGWGYNFDVRDDARPGTVGEYLAGALEDD